MIRNRFVLFAGLLLGWFALAALCYRDTNCTFLRAESGWYQLVAHGEDRGRVAAVREFFLHSHHGHYMPFAVLAEIEMTRLFGMHAQPWKWRAILAIALLGVALSSLIYRVITRSGAARSIAIAASVALTSLILLHPLLREFVGFPTLIYQLTWMLLFVLTLRFLLEAVTQPRQARWVWLSALTGYASMHTIGLGAITATTTAAILALVLLAGVKGKLPQFLSRRSHWLTALLLLIFCIGLHLAAMQLLRARSDPVTTGQPFHFSTMAGLVVSILLRVMEGLSGASELANFSIASFESQWPYGCLALVAGLSLWTYNLGSTLTDPTSARVTRCFLYTYSFFAFVALLLLIAARVPFETEADWFRPYLTNPRYVVPATLILSPALVAFSTSYLRRSSRTLSLAAALLVVALFLGNQNYYYTVYRYYPTARLVHEKVWHRIVEMARQCRAAQLPVPDIPTRVLGEFPWHLHDYDALLRYSLGQTNGNPIEYRSWEELDETAMQQYRTAAPSFQAVVSSLRLLPKTK